MRHALSFIIFLIPLFSYADIQVLAIENYSTVQNFPPQIVSNNGTTSSTTITISGGTAGASDGECTPGNLSVCNSCDGTSDVCNYRRISDGTMLKLTIVSKGTNALTGFPTVTNSQRGSNLLTNTSIAWPANSAYTIEIPWSKICEAIIGTSGASSCDIDKSGSVYVGFSKTASSSTCDDCIAINFNVMHNVTDNGAVTSEVGNCANGGGSDLNKGICDSNIQSADSRALITSTGPSTFPAATVTTTDGTVSKTFTAIRLLCKEGDPLTATDGQGTIQGRFTSLGIKSSDHCGDIALDENGDQKSSDIGGLENGKTYYFRTAMIDEAGNMSNYSKVADATTCTPASSFTCHVAVPDKIFGILSKDQNCFIATAAYGSPFRKEVAELRWFRDQVLSPHRLGKKLVNLYYQLSPPVAHFISEHNWARRSAQVLLIPLWTFSFLLREPLIGLVAILGVLSSLIFARRLKLNHRS